MILKKQVYMAMAMLLSASVIMGCGKTDNSQTRLEEQTQAQQAIPKVSVQLWSIKDDVKTDFKATLTKLAAMGFDGVEFAGEFGPFKDEPLALKAFLDSLNLKVSGAHVGFALMADDKFEQTVAFYQAINCPMLIVPYDERAFSADGVDWVVKELSRLSEKLAPYGIKVGYHNHAIEFDAYNGETYWDYIARNTPQAVVMQQDVGWTTYAGKNPVEYVRSYPQRSITTHFKIRTENFDGSVKKFPDVVPIIGQDNLIDWDNLIKADMEVGGTLWFVVEQEEYPNGLTPMQAVEASKQGLDAYLNKLKNVN